MSRSDVEGPARFPVDGPPASHARGALNRRRRGPRPDRPDRPPRRAYPLKWVALGLAAAAALLIGGPYLYFNVIEGSPPAPLHLPPASGVARGPLAPGPVSGTWVVSTGSLAGYRVDELLFGQAHTAVGRTPKVTGGMVISGTDVTAADFTVDMASVRSDQGSRDVQFRGFIMRTADHPRATFHLTSPVQLGQVPAVGRQITVQAIGDLTMRGVRRSVTFTLAAERSDHGSIDVNAEIPITFSLWHIPNPSFAVARVGSTGILEVLLRLVPSDAQGQPLAKAPARVSTTTVFVPGSF